MTTWIPIFIDLMVKEKSLWPAIDTAHANAILRKLPSGWFGVYLDRLTHASLQMDAFIGPSQKKKFRKQSLTFHYVK